VHVLLLTLLIASRNSVCQFMMTEVGHRVQKHMSGQEPCGAIAQQKTFAACIGCNHLQSPGKYQWGRHC